MRLAILTQYYPPETGAPQNRLSHLAAQLAAWGHTVEVLTALPNYPGTAVHEDYRGKSGMVEDMDGVRVARVGLYVPKQKTFMRRMVQYFSFTGTSAFYGPKLLSPADVLIMETPPIFLAPAGVHVARRLGAKLVVNTSDLWPQSIVELGMIKPGPSLWASQRLEHWMYEHAALLMGQTEGIVDDLRRRFPQKRVALYPNGIDTTLYAGPLQRDEQRRLLGWRDEQFVIGYAGVLGHSQRLDQVLDAAALLRDLPNLHFAFFGHGPHREQLELRIARDHITSAKIYPHQPRERMPHLWAAMDAGISPLANIKLFAGARPSKMFEIMAAGRPIIICAPRGEAQKIVEAPEGGPAGVCCEPEDPPGLAKAIRAMLADPAGARAMGERGRAHVMASFDRAQIAREIEALLIETIEKREAA